MERKKAKKITGLTIQATLLLMSIFLYFTVIIFNA